MDDAKNLAIWVGFMILNFIVLSILETVLEVPQI